VGSTATPDAGVPGTAQQHAVEWLRAAIVAGELVPGQRVAQEAVAARSGVSLIPVREALRILEGEGQVSYFPRRGYFVTELRIDDLEEIYELRQVLEERAVRRAVPRLGDEVLERMGDAARACSRAAAAGAVAEELAENRRFHFALFEAAGRPHAVRVIRSLWDATEAYRALYYNSPDERTAADDAHERILAAARARDADALVSELDAHRARALAVLDAILRRAA
jgi:DNA-binding GntR family transcriptional regulator